MTLRLLSSLTTIMPRPKEKMFYAIGVGRKTGIFNTWAECKTLIDGVTNAKFKKFDNYAAAEEFVNMWSHKKLILSQTGDGSASPRNSKEKSPLKGDDVDVAARAKKKLNCVNTATPGRVESFKQLHRSNSLPVFDGVEREARSSVKRLSNNRKWQSQEWDIVEVKLKAGPDRDQRSDVDVDDVEKEKPTLTDIKKRVADTIDDMARAGAADMLRKLVDVTIDLLKQITDGIVAAVAEEGLTQEALLRARGCVLEAEGVEDLVKDKDDRPAGAEDLGERIKECEKKIDAALEVLEKVLPVVTELRQTRSELSLMYREVCRGSEKSRATPLGSRSFSTCPCSHSPVKNGSKKGNVSPSLSCDSESDDLGSAPAKRTRTLNNFIIRKKAPKESNYTKTGDSTEVPFNLDKDGYVEVYTDGACSSNGRTGAKAGIGVWFGDGHPWNVSRPYQGDSPTNNNAEIQAARIAMELAVAAGISKLKIITDSEFLINCATEWVPMWKKRNWMTIQKQPVKNKVELVKLDNLLPSLSVRWEKVEGHAGVKGNEMADSLAVKGAAQYSVH